MAIYRVTRVGDIGEVSDLYSLDLPANAWTTAISVRFENGAALSAPGYLDGKYGTPSVAPYHLCPVLYNGTDNYVIYAGAAKIYGASNSGTQTNLTRQTAGVDVNYTASRHSWTSTLLSGIPILNNGTDPPQSWDLNTANNFAALANWPASTTAQSVRAYKNYLVAMGVTKSGTYYPHLVKWSHPADPGSVPSSWDETDATVDAGEYDVCDSWDRIVDGLQMRDSFFIYKNGSIWRMDFIGGTYVFRFSKAFSSDGVMAKNCVVEHDGMHVVVTNSDVVIHDGVNMRSLLNNKARKRLMSEIDHTYWAGVFAMKCPLHNEIWVCYPYSNLTADSTYILRINMTTGAVSSQNFYGIAHGAVAHVNTISTPWYSTWTTDNLAINAPRLLLADSAGSKIRIADGDDEYLVAPTDNTTTIERRGFTIGERNRRYLITAVRPKILGTDAGTVDIVLQSLTNYDDSAGEAEQSETQTYTIGTTYDCPFTIEGRYFSIKFTGWASPQWRLESYDIIYEDMGEW